SRRRHTRSKRDWSSDVCSSDLFSALGVTEISRTVCELLEWKRPNGKLKHHECRQLLERLQAEGVLTLPALRNLGGRGPRRVDLRQPRFQSEPRECAVSECQPREVAQRLGAGVGDAGM